MARRVLITGISRFLGQRLARRLEEIESIEEIIGVDLEPPATEFKRTEVVKADIRNPLFVKVLQAAEVDTVVHTNLLTSEGERGASAVKEINVIGTMQLLAACQKSESLRKVVVKSTTAVYGSEPHDPAFFTEQMSRGRSPSSAFSRDALDVETYARDFGRRRPDVCLTILRFANVLGHEVNNLFSQYLAQPVVPTLAGFDPRIQFIHQEDALEILFRATVEDHAGIYNAAANQAVYLSQVIRRAGRVQAPVLPPNVWTAEQVLRVLPFVNVPTSILREIAYGRVADNSRLREEMGYDPKFTCLDAVHDFREKKRAERIIPGEASPSWEADLREFVTRKQAERRPDLSVT